MIRLPVAERRFALALIVSAAIHAALLPMLLSFASGSATRHVQPIRESCIKAFLVPGHLAAAGKTVALPGRKRREADRAAPVAAAPPREVPENVAPAEKEGKNLLADIRPPAEWLGKGHDAGALPAPASPASPVLFPGGGDLSGSNGAGISAARRGGGEFSGGMAQAPPPPGEKERGKPVRRGAAYGPRRTPTRFPGTGTMPAPPILRWRGCGAIREWWSCLSKFLSMVASVRWESDVPPVMKFWTGRPWRPSGRGDSNRAERRGGL